MVDLIHHIHTKFFEGGKGDDVSDETLPQSSFSYEDLLEKEGMSRDVAKPFAEKCFSVRQRKILNFLQKFAMVCVIAVTV
jgi:hypothetical protein